MSRRIQHASFSRHTSGRGGDAAGYGEARRRRRLLMRVAPLAAIVALASLPGSGMAASVRLPDFPVFESEQFRPLATSPSGRRLFAVNTPDNRLEIFDVTEAGLHHRGAVGVGLEPVAVAARSDGEVWVVNHLSDSVSVVNVTADPPYVERTLLVGDEPRDIVFAGPDGSRAFITAAHRGQNGPWADTTNPGELTTPGVGRADVWVFDATSLGAALGGTPLAILTLFGDVPGPLARSADGRTVYAGIFKSGNRTTTLVEPLVCDGGVHAPPCQSVPGEATSPGGLPPPNDNVDGVAQQEVGLIVRHDGSAWRDELGRDWSAQVRFQLPDLDVFALDASGTGPPVETRAFAGVGTILFGIATNPVSGRIYVANTEAENHVRFGGARPPSSSTSTVQGRLALARITVLDPSDGSVRPRHLNKHIDYAISPAPPGVSERSLATPQGIAVSRDGRILFVAANGSRKLGIFSTVEIEGDTFVPDANTHVELSGGGPTGLALDDTRGRAYVLTRFDNAISVVDIATRREIAHHPLFNPEPADVVEGRPLLYDARETSSNGEASCASCHVGADKDELAWDLGDPLGSVAENPNPFLFRPPVFAGSPFFHPMKGPMTTQTLRGLDNHGPMHWRGDKTGGAEHRSMNESSALDQFNGAFVELQGRADVLPPLRMRELTKFLLHLVPPPNPIRNLDDSLTPLQAEGRDLYDTLPLNAFGAACNTCHVLDPDRGHFGTAGLSTVDGPPFSRGITDFKVPHLRNVYEKVGMFGMAATPVTVEGGDFDFTGDQIRGFGFFHDGAFDSGIRTLRLAIFDFPEGDAQRRPVEQFMYAFDSNLKPIVGQQITLDAAPTTEVSRRVDLLVERARAGDADLVVRAVVGGAARSWAMRRDWTFQSDRQEEEPVHIDELRGLAGETGQQLTFTAVPPGSGERIGIDRDADGAYDRDELDAGTNPADPASVPEPAPCSPCPRRFTPIGVP